MTSAAPSASSLELMLGPQGRLIDWERASPLAIETAWVSMAPATKAAIIADIKCFLRWCMLQRPVAIAVPATPETLVCYLHWLGRDTAVRAAAKPSTQERRIASIACVHRILGFGHAEPLPTQAGMVRDTLKTARRRQGTRKQAAPLRFRAPMASAEANSVGMTIEALLAACGDDPVGLRDAALMSMTYDAGLRVSELVAARVCDLRQLVDGSGRLEIARVRTDQDGMGSIVWLSPKTMARLSGWLSASRIEAGSIFRRINILPSKKGAEGQRVLRYHVGACGLTRQGVVGILRRRAAVAIAGGHVEIEPGFEAKLVEDLSTHSFRVGLAQDLLAAGEHSAGVALALRWSSPTTALRYARESAADHNAAARVVSKLQS